MGPLLRPSRRWGEGDREGERDERLTFIGAGGDGPSCQGLGGSTAQYEGYVKSHSLRDRPTDRKLILCGKPPFLRRRTRREETMSFIGGRRKVERKGFIRE